MLGLYVSVKCSDFMFQERIGHPAPRDDPETHLEDLESNMTTFLYLTVILSKMIKVWYRNGVFQNKKLTWRLIVVLSGTILSYL